jgi:multisubunit Na+/H+ antiporter MnhG subunit
MTPGKKSSEYGLTKNVGTAGAAGLLVALVTALMQDGGIQSMELSWPTAALLIVVILSLASVVVSYNISRGMAKSEARAETRDDSPGA